MGPGTTMRYAAIPLALLACACSVGTGSGQLTGSVVDPVCRLDLPDYSMNPNFFAADVVEDTGAPDGSTRERLTIRIQRDSYREGDSDGLLIYIDDVNEIGGAIAASGVMSIPVAAESGAPVQMTLYLNETCESGPPDAYEQIPAIFEAFGGTITFSAIYAPDLDSEATEITATLDGITFLDPDDATRSATISGHFTFQYQRGRPAQYFP